jgi:acetyl esterase/lipase
LGANYQGASPVWISVGDTEILRDDARRIQQRLKDQGVAVKFREAHDLPHVWPIFHNILPEARQTLDELASWIKALPRPANES